VIAADSAHARRIAALLRECTGRAPLVVLHAEPRAAEKLVRFTRSRDPWIVAVNMVSEGVDIPRLRVGVYATAAKTPLVFRQIVGRFVRALPGRPIEPSWLYVPADRILREHASAIEQELRHVLARPDTGDELGLDEPERVARAERSEEPAFVPLSADVAPQLSLFGPAPAAGAAITGSVPPPPGDQHADDRPAFERRAMLRSERHRLVSEVTRRDRTDHREVNAWLNHRVGVSSVESATLEQLERSVELLVGRLTRRR
jgi:superfamily II DNA or RNA helicase